MSKNNINFTGAVLHIGQVEIVKDILDHNAFYHVIVTPRQFGKSFMAIQLMLYYALNYPNSKLMFTSPVYSQASKIYKELMDGIRDCGIIKKFNSAENSIIFINDSELFFKSVQLADNLRGYSIDYLFLDEAAMYKPDVFSAVLRPMLTVRGKKCFLFSTPKGKNWFYELYLKGMNNEPRYLSYKGSSDMNPFANRDEINDARKALPENLFKQEYLAEFIDDGGSVFQGISKISTLTKWQEPIPGDVYYAGIDIAMQGDYFVMTVLNKNGDIVYAFRDTKKQMSFMLKQIDLVFKKYNPRYTLVETNGIGGGIYEFIAKIHRSVAPFNTSNSSKQDIIEDLIFDIQEERVHIPTMEFFPHYINEMNTFSFTYSPKSRKVVYGALSGMHDDTVMSLAIANYAKKTGSTKGIYAVY
jgi:hypothetical protein